jgi:dTDP-4-dehydrorhamnose 3,5-epimerase
MVIVPPGVVHGYKCVSEVDAYSINLPDKLFKGEGKKEEVDEIRWEDDKNSPYQINN